MTKYWFLLGILLLPTVLANAVFTNEPPGLTPLADTIWNATAPTPGTVNDPWRFTGGNGVYISADVTAPLNPQSVLTERYPVGFPDGGSPGTTYFDFNPNGNGALQKEVFVAFYWKASDPYQQHPAGLTKIAFIVRSGNSNGQEIIRMGGNKEPYRIDINSEYGGTPATVTKAPNRAVVPINLGQWYKIEWYVKGESALGANDGVVRWWVDDQLAGDYSGIAMDTVAFSQFKFSSTWGGNSGAVKNQTDYFWIDHTYLAGSPGAFNILCGNNACTNHESCLSCPTDCCTGGTPPPVSCGNGIKEGAEQCDLGSGNGVCPATCSTSCTTNNCGGDTTPPVATITSPTQNQVLPYGTTQWTLAVNTNEPATCKHHSADTTYANMSNTFNSGALLTSFSDTLSNLQNGQTRNKFVRCQDAAGNAMARSTSVTFSISSTPTTKTGDLNKDGIVNILDVQRVVSKLGQSGVTTGEDVNTDGAVDLFDLVQLARNWG